MEEQTSDIEIPIGTKEQKKLEPTIVKIVKAEVKLVGDKGNKKVSCTCKHPEREEAIIISSVAYKDGNTIKHSGLWLNKDEDGNIKKGSALAQLLSYYGCLNIRALEDKEIGTELDDKGYLCLKSY